MSPIAELARRQLEAYNRADTAAFCACYHPQVRVLDADGSVSLEGLEDFRARYGAMFERFTAIEGVVDQRLSVGDHCVDLERWSRTDPQSGETSTGEVLVRYTLRDGLIGTVQFFR